MTGGSQIRWGAAQIDGQLGFCGSIQLLAGVYGGGLRILTMIKQQKKTVMVVVGLNFDSEGWNCLAVIQMRPPFASSLSDRC